MEVAFAPQAANGSSEATGFSRKNHSRHSNELRLSHAIQMPAFGLSTVSSVAVSVSDFKIGYPVIRFL